MWMEWTEWNVSISRLIAQVLADDPEVLVRFDFLGEGWGCSLCPSSPFPDGGVEVYGEGLSPRSAVEDAVDKWFYAIAAA